MVMPLLSIVAAMSVYKDKEIDCFLIACHLMNINTRCCTRRRILSQAHKSNSFVTDDHNTRCICNYT